MKNLISFILMLFVVVFVSGCGTKYARPDRCACEVAPVAVEPVEEVAQEEPVEEEVVPQEEDNTAVGQALKEAVKNNDKEFMLDFEKIAHQSLFESGSDKISQDIYENLDSVAKFLKENPNVTVRVEGHTDSTGSKAFNQTLSEKRAKAVANYLIEQGVDSSKVTTKGYGPSKPVATNATPEGRVQNRRTELKFKVGDVEQTQVIQNASGSAEVK